MQAIIERYVRSSLGGDLYDKAFECLSQLRQAAVSEDEAPTFNKFLEHLKSLYSTGPHQGFFAMLVKAKFSLITKQESEISSVVTPAEAEAFLKEACIQPKPAEKANPKKKDDDDFDLID